VNVALVVITDGRRELVSQAIASLDEAIPFVDYRLIVDDSGDENYGNWLEEQYDSWAILHHPERQGCSAAVRTAWASVASFDYVWHAEDDFTYNEPVDLERMMGILQSTPYLSQLALKRQPHGPVEGAAGDLMAVEPDRWCDHEDFCHTDTIFTFNPCLIPRWAIEVALSCQKPMTEPNVTEVFAGRHLRFGYLGRTTDPPRVTHIGDHRMQGWLP